MKRSMSSLHGGSTAIALTVGGAVAVLAAQIWPVTPEAAVAIQTLIGALVRFVEALIAPDLERRAVRAKLEAARLHREKGSL